MGGARRWKPALLRLHRWIALSIGFLLTLNAATGLTLLFGEPIDKALHPALFKVEPQATRVSWESIRRSLEPEFGRQTIILRPPRRPDEPVSVDIRGDVPGQSAWEGQVLIDPYTGRRLGRRDRVDFDLNGVFEWHSQLLSGAFGKGLLALCALGMVVMFLTGLVMWWPIRWSMAFKVVLGRGRARSLFDLHRVAGVVFGLWVIVISAGTGGVLAWRPATVWLNQMAGQSNLDAPTFKPTPEAPKATLDDIVASGEAALPGGSIGSIQIPAGSTQALRIRKKVDGDPHPNGLSTLWLNPRTGRVLRVDRWNATAWIFAAHSGRLGAAGFVLTAISGVALLGFGVTGTWLWWLRRKARRPASPTTLPASPRIDNEPA